MQKLGGVFCSCFAVLLLLGCPLPAQQNGNMQTESYNGDEAVAGEVLVKFRPATSFAALIQAEFEADAIDAQPIGSAGTMRFHSASRTVAQLVRELAARPDVEYAEPNYIYYATDSALAIPNDPRFAELWGLRNTTTPDADISAVPAWDISTGSRSSVAVVIDTGIDYSHPDLEANVWSAPTDFTVDIGGTSISCKAGTHGFNAIINTCDPMDDHYHGTHVSGTIGAVGNNGLGVVGVNWTASIMGAKFLDNTGRGDSANAVNAIEFVIQAKAAFGGPGGTANVRVLSNSWGGGPFSQSLLDAINKASDNNMLFVAAAGNNGRNNDAVPNYPSNYATPNMVAVAATASNDGLASFSNYGLTTVHLGAPGVNTLSTTPNNAYNYLSGTSMATPHVSGAALLILSVCALDTAPLKALLLNNVDPISSLSGKTITGGRLNVNKAIRACASAGSPDFSLSTDIATQTVVQGDSAAYAVSIAPTGGFAGDVTFDLSGFPDFATASFDPNPATAASTLTVVTDPATPAGTYTLTIMGTSGSLTHTTQVTLVITQP